MKIDLRWQLLLVVICLGLVLSLLSYQIQTVGLCTTRVPSTGGRLGVGMVGRPDKINPLFSEVNPIDQELASLIYDGLLRYDENGLLVPALAESWVVSDDQLTVRFELRDDISWHDGRPFTAEDVLFTYGLIQSEDLPVSDELKSLWAPVVISTTNDTTIDFTLPQPYGPFLDATTLGILPAHVLADVPVTELLDDPFNRSPIGTGPFSVSPGVDWEQTGQVRLVPNPQNWRRTIQIDTLDYRFFPDAESLAAAFKDGTIQAIAGMTPEYIPDILTLPGIRLFSSPAPQMTQLLFNSGDSASPVVRSLPGRQALAHAVNRAELIDLAVDGQGLPLEGPYTPTSWAYDEELLVPVVHDPAFASALLGEAGWVVIEGNPLREKDGEKLTLRLLFTDEGPNEAISRVLIRQWGEIGIETVLVIVDPEDMQDMLSEGQFDVALVHVDAPRDPDLYDFWSQEAIINGQNFGSWNHRLASEELERGRQLYTTDDRALHYSGFLRFFGDELPALTLYQGVDSFALSETVEQADVGLIGHPRDRYESLPDWFLLFREVSVTCPEEEL